MFTKIKSRPKGDIQDGRQNTVFLLKCMKAAFKTQFIPILVKARDFGGSAKPTTHKL